MIFDHLGIHVSDFRKTRAFLVDALLPLDLHVVAEGENWAMIGREGRGEFWFGEGGAATTPVHIAFAAYTREAVREFHRIALAAGGQDNGAPGIRAQYGPTYYGAFVIGPDGHNFEAVTRMPSD